VPTGRILACRTGAGTLIRCQQARTTDFITLEAAMTSPTDSIDLHMNRPSVYLDQWVWLRLAKAAAGEPREPTDSPILASVIEASAAGVDFPPSSTHYVETAKIIDPRKRATLARAMASVSRCRTLRSRQVLLRHQFLHAMHATFGRPAFRPTPLQVFASDIHRSWLESG
jgi:hypothetical protein